MPHDVFLVVEVMDTSAPKDRRVKLRIYARAGVAELWLADVNRNLVEICRAPAGDQYRERQIVGREGSVSPRAFPALDRPVADILG